MKDTRACMTPYTVTNFSSFPYLPVNHVEIYLLRNLDTLYVHNSHPQLTLTTHTHNSHPPAVYRLARFAQHKHMFPFVFPIIALNILEIGVGFGYERIAPHYLQLLHRISDTGRLANTAILAIH